MSDIARQAPHAGSEAGTDSEVQIVAPSTSNTERILRVVVPLTADRLQWWIGVMTEQEMLKKPPVVSTLINP